MPVFDGILAPMIRAPHCARSSPALTHLATALVLALTAACGGSSSPTQPSPAPLSSTPSAPSSTTSLAGRIVGALDDAGQPGLTVQVTSGPAGVSDASGQFLVSGVTNGLQFATVSGSAIVTRQTGLTAPGTGITLPVIPATFDMASFSEMLRTGGRLQRWMAAPRLVVIARVLQFTATADDDFAALDEPLSASDVEELTRDLADGYAALTGGRLGAFAGVTIELPAPGAVVRVKREGDIVVARHKGLTAATRYWGYGRWAMKNLGEVVGGIVFLDRDFETSGHGSRRSLRIHELGHALGYNHVTARTSAMNTSASVTPNEWDAQAVRIAFQRPPGNAAPDTDPSVFSANLRPFGTTNSPTVWGPWIH